ncbi:DUF3397 family protein [Latilactobacillus graminis]|nr:DUF3397 family protein [Latilactobacillus graminis]QFP79812.1 DUF3397 family protein [Latilactobacillus graminis]
MPLTTTLLFASLPLICLAIGYGLNWLARRLFKYRLPLVDLLPIPLLISAVYLSLPVFRKAGWFFSLAICLWGIIWILTRFYFEHALYLHKFLHSWWRFIFVMSGIWYVSFLIISLL